MTEQELPDPTNPTLDELIERQKARLAEREKAIEEEERKAAQRLTQDYLKRTNRA